MDPTCKLGDYTAFIMYQTIFFIIAVGTVVMLWMMYKICSMAPNARRYRESTEIRKEMIQVSPGRGRRDFWICVEHCARSGKFVKSFGLGDKEEVYAHYLKMEVKRLREEADGLESEAEKAENIV